MGLFRLVFWLALIGAGFWLWRRLGNRPKAKPGPDAVTMVRCAQCGVHVPQHNALPAGGRWYCSRAHLDQSNPPGGH